MPQTYQIVKAENLEMLVNRVNVQMEQGWRVSGGMTETENHYTQAMHFDKPVKDYVVVDADTPESLSKAVLGMLSAGWHLQGGATGAITFNDGSENEFPDTRYCQAMVKY